MYRIKVAHTEEERGLIVKRVIEETAARLAYNTNLATRSSENSYYFEKLPNMPSYWADSENFERLLKLIDRNLMFLDDLKPVCRQVNKVINCPSDDCSVCRHHPFSMLYNLGMLGYIVVSEDHSIFKTQMFLDSKDVTYFHDQDVLQINAHTMYLLHPAITKSIEKIKNDKIKHFCGFLIGKGTQVKQSVLCEILKDRSEMDPDEFEKKYYKEIRE